MSDTIAAISSSVGPTAARVIVRMSGPGACDIARSIAAHLPPAPAAVRVALNFADLRCPVWLYVFRAPASYTGEDLIEFHLPGSALLAKLLLDELLMRGARLAEPGEFTSRAFLAGKMDLTAAEGVAAVIAAANATQLAAARQLLAGELARRLAGPMEQLAETLALVEAGIDFGDEGIGFLDESDIARRAESLLAEIDALLEGSDRFEQLAAEPRIVLLGWPNAGKSTLINTLTGTPRAVVSPTAGTTRDALSAALDLPRGRVLLVDVAGLDPADPQLAAGATPKNRIDSQAQAMARRAAESAHHAVLVQDATDPRPPPPLPRPPDLLVRTKTDLLEHPPQSHDCIQVSAKSGTGIPALRVALDTLAFGAPGTGARLALSARHAAALAEVRTGLRSILTTDPPRSPELLADELRHCLNALGRVLGQVSPDEILGRIFSTFCIGK